MGLKIWIRYWLLSIIIILIILATFNYIVDPYGIYNSKVIDAHKIKRHDKIRLVKAIDIKEKNIKSIILGTSRATYGYNPNHKYFQQPAYNAALPGASIYENLIYLKGALEYNNIKNILLVLDYKMFNSKKQKKINDLETYFTNGNLKYKYLLSLTQLKDSIATLKKNNKNIKIYLENGFRKENINIKKIKNRYQFMLEDESTYYKGYPTNYIYSDTKNNSMDDLKELLQIVKNNNLNLTIIFGPSHIRLWESLDYHLDYNLWLKWKKDIVIQADNILNKNVSIYDFSVYNKYTNEKLSKTDKKMKYFIDSNHYRQSLGSLVLNYLNNDFKDETFAVKLNINNIDLHLKQLKNDRIKYIDIDKYKKTMDEYINKKGYAN